MAFDTSFKFIVFPRYCIKSYVVAEFKGRFVFHRSSLLLLFLIFDRTVFEQRLIQELSSTISTRSILSTCGHKCYPLFAEQLKQRIY